MIYDHIKPYMIGGLVLHYAMRVSCSKCGAALGYDRDVKRVTFCPVCGHELHRLSMNVSPGKIVEVLNKEEAK